MGMQCISIPVLAAAILVGRQDLQVKHEYSGSHSKLMARQAPLTLLASSAWAEWAEASGSPASSTPRRAARVIWTRLEW